MPSKENKKAAVTGRRGFLTGTGAGLAGLAASSVFADRSRSIPEGLAERHTIEHIEAFKVVVPMRPGSIYTEGFGPNLYDWSFDQIPKFLIRMHTDTGLIGLGETSRGTEDMALAQNIEYLTGKDIFTINPAAQASGLPQLETSDAFEIAYYDIVAKALGVPVHVLLGGRLQDKVAVTYWTGQRTVADLQRIAMTAVEKGFKHLKFKARHGDPIVKQTEALSRKVPNLGLTVDFNESYKSLNDFLPIGKELDNFEIMLEDPIPRRIESFVELREALNNPIVLTPTDQRQMLDAIIHGACDIFNIAGTVDGGPMAEFVKEAFLAEVAGISVWHGSGIELGVKDMSFVHAIAATRSCTIPSDIISYLRESDLLAEPLRVVDGYVLVPQTPGLGVELDDDKVRRYQVPMNI